MKLTKEELETVLAIAKESGYIGVSGGTYRFENGATTKSPNVMLRRMNLKEELKQRGAFRLLVEYESLSAQIVEALDSVKHVREFQNPESDAATSEASQSLVEKLQSNIVIFKTVRKDGVYDPGSNRTNGMSLIAFNVVTREIVNARVVSIDGLLALRGLTRDDVIESREFKSVWPIFNPYTSETTFTAYEPQIGEEVFALNTAIPPKWLRTYPSLEGGLGGFIGKLIYHLFPYEEDREAVLDWCHYALFKRNGTVLCLAGDRGTGKSTFVEILSAMLGERYTEIVSEAVLREKFNGQFLNKRLIIFEEVALDEPQSINKIKAWCNSKISIEEKGVNAFNAENFSSMVFLMNDLSQLKVNAQERRFSIPVVAEENLLKAVTEKEIGDFKRGMIEESNEVLKELAAFGHFLRSRIPKNSEYIPIKGPNFNRVADLTMIEWQSHLRDYLKENGEEGVIIPISKIFPTHREEEKGAMRVPQKRSTIENFLRDYRYLGKYKLGDVVDLPMEEKVLKKHTAPHLEGRTRRQYGIRPRSDFLKAAGIKYLKPEDLI